MPATNYEFKPTQADLDRVWGVGVWVGIVIGIVVGILIGLAL